MALPLVTVNSTICICLSCLFLRHPRATPHLDAWKYATWALPTTMYLGAVHVYDGTGDNRTCARAREVTGDHLRMTHDAQSVKVVSQKNSRIEQ